MSKSLKDRLEYLIALVSEFAAAHHMSLQQVATRQAELC